jgi:oxygen-dependent protoporphyrinogen oxidase
MMAERSGDYDVIVIGAGASGLAAAYELHRGGCRRFVLLEAGERVGGALKTDHVGDFIVEGGPDSFLTHKPAVADLCRELGMRNALVPSNEAGRRTLLFRRGRLYELPDGWQFLAPARLWPALRTPLLSTRTKWRLAREIFAPPADRAEDGDESVAAFVRRHFGDETLEVIAAPLLAGVYGGDPEQLSIRSVLPRFAEMGARGSIVRQLLKARGKVGRQAGDDSDVTRRSSGPPAMAQRATGDETQRENPSLPNGKPAAGATGMALFSTLRDGMESLALHLLAEIGADRVRTLTTVLRIGGGDGGYAVHLASGEVLRSRAVILATPAWAAAEMLREAAPALAETLLRIPYSSALTVSLGWQRAPALPNAFGFLVPRTERLRMLACTFAHRKFPGRLPEGAALLRCFYGGATDPTILSLDDGEALATAQRELRAVLGPIGTPDFLRISRWPRMMAQYTVGHAARLARIAELAETQPGLHLAGNAYRGIGVPDCIESGRAAARAALKRPSGRAVTP